MLTAGIEFNRSVSVLSINNPQPFLATRAIGEAERNHSVDFLHVRCAILGESTR